MAVLDIVQYGDPILRKKCVPVKDFLILENLLDDMFDTMYAASGVGLAAPQIGKSIRLFVVDDNTMMEEGEQGMKKAFINPEIIEEDGDDWAFEEGCLSIPGIRADVERPEIVKIKYFDEDWNEHIEEYDDIHARVIQHEYDHIDGILFTDYLTPFKKRMLKGKLTNISKGKVDADYRVKAPKK